MLSPARPTEEEVTKLAPHFGRYLVVRELGRGGMARVFEGRHSELGHRVALKVMEPALAAQPMAAARFLREAKAASQIRHQHVVEVFDVGVDHGLPFIVMEFLEGSNLAALLGEKGALALSGLVDVFLPALSAVATAHEAGIIHRDLKPSNLMLTRRAPRVMHPMVLDFGISKITNEEPDGTLTRSESLLGTVQYMAPELTKGAKFASHASDQYALGVMLYECATGRRPFEGGSHYELMHAIVTAPVVPPSRIRPELPPEFDALVEKAMNRDPDKRFPSVRALGSALLSFGDRTAWSLWESEFLGTGHGGDPWATPTSTLTDSIGATPNVSRPSRRARTGRRRPRWLLPLLSLYAATLTVVMVRRTFERREAAASVTTAAPGERAMPEPLALRTVGEAPLQAHPVAGAEPEIADRSTAPSTSVPSARSKPRLRTPVPVPATTASAARNADSPPARNPGFESSILVGANGAPIVD